MVYLLLANGFETVEGLAVVDAFRRARIDIKMVSMNDDLSVKTSHGVKIEADLVFKDNNFSDGEMLILPGGLEGTKALKQNPSVKALLLDYYNQGKYIAAICAAPSVLASAGILSGKKATIFPGMDDYLLDAKVSHQNVVIDGNIITSRGAYTAFDFALELVGILSGDQVKKQVEQGIAYYR